MPRASSHDSRNRDSSRLWRIVMWVLGALVFLVALPLVLVAWPVVVLRQKRRIARFHARFDGRLILVWHSRRGWRDFCVNNLLPVLPSETVSICDDRAQGTQPDRHAMREAERVAGCAGVARPYLAWVAVRRLHTASLNRVLQPLKRSAKRDSAVQEQVGAIVRTRLAEESHLVSDFDPAGSKGS